MKRNVVYPGDLVVWIDTSTKRPVYAEDKLLSSITHDYVTIGLPSLLISIVDGTYTWLNPDGLFSAYAIDIIAYSRSRREVYTCEIRDINTV